MKLDQGTLQIIDRCFAEFFAANRNPGFQFAISHKGEIIHTGSLGLRSVHPDLPFMRDSVSRIASMTKSFATAAVLQLRDLRLVDLQAPLAAIAPHLQLSKPFAEATLHDLMAMRLDLPIDDPWADRLLDATDEELDPYFQTPLIRAGLGNSHCSYSNLSYLLLGRIIAHISGQSAMEYITDQILKPLGLGSTVWNPAGELEARAAIGYRVDCDPYQPEHHFVCRSDGTVFGGLWSSVDDLATWLEFLRADPAGPPAWNSVLSAKSRREMWGPYSHYSARPHTCLITGQPLNAQADYGFGLVRSTFAGAEYLAHSGGLPGFGSHMRVHTATGLGAILLGNGTYCNASLPCASVLHYLVSSLDPEIQRCSEWVFEAGALVGDFILAGGVTGPQDLFTYNFWLDTMQENAKAEIATRLHELGENVKVESVLALSGYQGEIVFVGSTGTKKLEFRLAPHLPPRVQSMTWL